MSQIYQTLLTAQSCCKSLLLQGVYLTALVTLQIQQLAVNIESSELKVDLDLLTYEHLNWEILGLM